MTEGNFLAIDTATEALGLSLRVGSETRTLLLQAGLRHSETLLPNIQRLLAEAGIKAADLRLIVCSLGPGSFTGIRIGLAAAKGLAFASGCRLTGASTLDGLAWRYGALPIRVAAANAGLRRRCHAALYLQGRREGEYLEMESGELAARLAGEAQLMITGSAAESLYRRLVELRGADGLLLERAGVPCDPLGLLEAGLSLGSEAAEELHPLYLRKSEAELKRDGA